MAIVTETRLWPHCPTEVDPHFDSHNPGFEEIYRTLTALNKSLNSLEAELGELEKLAPKFDHRFRVWVLSEDLRRSWRRLRKTDDKFQAGADAHGMVKVGDPNLRVRNITQLEMFVGQLGGKWKGLHRRLLMVEQALPPTGVRSAVKKVGNAAKCVIRKV